MNNIKLNAKDLAAGLFFVLVAVAGLWLNQDHALGSARRMGPGYMPMLVFWVQIGFAVLVLVLALFSGPDPLQRWTGLESSTLAIAVALGFAVWRFSPALGPFFSQTYNGVGLGVLAGFLVLCWAAGWRRLGFVLASMCLFALLLEKAGMMVAIIALIFTAALAEPDHRAHPIGVLGLTIFLLALCWWIFISQLDIRVSVWPWSY